MRHLLGTLLLAALLALAAAPASLGVALVVFPAPDLTELRQARDDLLQAERWAHQYTGLVGLAFESERLQIKEAEHKQQILFSILWPCISALGAGAIAWRRHR